MYAYFNELSAYPHVPSIAVLAAIDGFADTCREIREHGVKKIACENGIGSIQLSDTETLHTYCFSNKRNIKVQLLLSVFTKPYLIEDSSEEERFVEKSYFTIVKNSEGENQTIHNPMGLSAAYICGSFAVSLGSTDFWKTIKDVPLHVDDGTTVKINLVKNVSENGDFCI